MTPLSRATREAILEELSRVGRERSDATVLFHATLASQLNLHPTDYKVLSILERLGAMSAGEIGRYAGLATASVTNLVDRLERKGFVRRMADARDRRRVMVESIVERVTVPAGCSLRPAGPSPASSSTIQTGTWL